MIFFFLIRFKHTRFKNDVKLIIAIASCRLAACNFLLDKGRLVILVSCVTNEFNEESNLPEIVKRRTSSRLQAKNSRDSQFFSFCHFTTT